MKNIFTTYLRVFFCSIFLMGIFGAFTQSFAAPKSCGPNNYTDMNGVSKGVDSSLCISLKCNAEEIENLIPGCFSDGFSAPDRENISDKINEESFRTQVLKIINYFLTFLGLLAVISIVYAGIIMVSDFGNDELVGKAKNILLWSAIGMIIVLLSFSFVNFILNIGEQESGQPLQCFETSTSIKSVNCTVCDSGWITEKNAAGATKRVCKQGARQNSSITMCENNSIPCFTCTNGWNLLTKTCLGQNANAESVQCVENGETKKCMDCSFGGWNEANRKCFDASVVSPQSPLKCNNGEGLSIPCFMCLQGWESINNTCLPSSQLQPLLCLETNGQQVPCSSCNNDGFNTANRQCFDEKILSNTPTQCNNQGAQIACNTCPSGGWNTVTKECIQVINVPINTNNPNNPNSPNFNNPNNPNNPNFNNSNNPNSPNFNNPNNPNSPNFNNPNNPNSPNFNNPNNPNNPNFNNPNNPNSPNFNNPNNPNSPNFNNPNNPNNPNFNNPNNPNNPNFNNPNNPNSPNFNNPNSSIDILDTSGNDLNNIGKIDNETALLLSKIQNASRPLQETIPKIASIKDQNTLNEILKGSGLSETEKKDLRNILKKNERKTLGKDFQELLSKASRGELASKEIQNIKKAFTNTSRANIDALINDTFLNDAEKQDMIKSLNKILTPNSLLQKIRTGQIKGDELNTLRKQLSSDANDALGKLLNNETITKNEEDNLIKSLNRIQGNTIHPLLTKALNNNLSRSEKDELNTQLQEQSEKIIDTIDSKDFDKNEKQELEKAIIQMLLSDPKNSNNTLINEALNGTLEQEKLDDLLKNLSPEAGTLLKKSHSPKLINTAERKIIEDILSEHFSAIEVENALKLLDEGKRIPENEESAIKKALEAQGIDPQIAKNLIDKIQTGKVLTIDESNIVTSALKYGFVIQRFETGLKIIFDAMPKTALNMSAYNDVITALTELKAEPTNEKKLLLLKQTFNDLKKIIASTPKVIAKIQATPKQGTAPLIVTFDGSDSFDPNEQTIPHANYSWSFKDYNGVSQKIGTGPITDYVFEKPGLYIIELKVETANKINEYKTAMDGFAKTRIKVEPQISDLRIFINSKEMQFLRKINIQDAKRGISFDASESIAKVGRQIVEYKWSFGDGAQDSIENAETVIHSYKEVGVYKVKLEAKDNTGAVSSRNFKVIVEHLTANIEATPEKGNTTTLFKLRSNNSKSSDSLIQEYYWEIRNNDGIIVHTDNTENTSFRTNKPGKYNAKLSISDAEGNQATELIVLHISSLTPTANFTIKKEQLSFPSVRIFDASSSSDPEGEPLTYSWDFNGDGIFEVEGTKNSSTEHRFEETGSYKIYLKATDPYGEEDMLIRNMYIDSILNVDFDLNALAIQKNQEIIASPESNYATDFFWSFGDDTNSSGSLEPVTHKYDQSGNYMITLTVFDKDNNKNSVSKRVFVGDGESPVAAYEVQVSGRKNFPRMNICEEGLGIAITRRDTINLSGAPSINIDGTAYMLDYNWDFGDGEFGSTKVSAHRYSEKSNDECYKVVLRVKDRITGKSNSTEALYVKVMNIAPVIQKLIIQENVEIENNTTPYEVRLRAQGAYDPDGNIKKYRWWYRRVDEDIKKKRGLIQTQTPYANLTILSDGISGMQNEYVFVVEMTDNEGVKTISEDLLGPSNSLVVNNGNVYSPIVDFTMDKNQIYIGDTVSFFAQVKDFQNKSMNNVNYEWDFNGDGIFDDTTTGMQVTQKFDTPGEFSVRLRVKTQGLATSKRHTIYVDQITRYPLAAFTYQVQNNDLFANASTSRYDPALEDTTLRYAWDFDKLKDSDGDGNPANDVQSSLINPQYNYKENGDYFIILTLIDSLGNVDTVERKIRIGSNTSSSVSTSNTKLEKRSVIFSSKTSPITTLDLTLNRSEIKTTESTNISARIINADSSVYKDEVIFEIIEGNAILENDVIQAKNGIATTTIYTREEGAILIKVIAKNTFYETLEDVIRLKVNPTVQMTLEPPTPNKDEININTIREQESANTFKQIQ